MVVEQRLEAGDDCVDFGGLERYPFKDDLLVGLPMRHHSSRRLADGDE